MRRVWEVWQFLKSTDEILDSIAYNLHVIFRDVEHASGFTAKSGRCVSRLACNFQPDTKPGIVADGDDNASKEQVVDTESLDLTGVENVKSVEDPEADTAMLAEDLAEVPDVTITQPVKELNADKMQSKLNDLLLLGEGSGCPNWLMNTFS